MFTVRTLAEKAVTYSSYKITVLLLEISKSFDMVDQGTLLKDLAEILEMNELHMISILLKVVTLLMRI